MATLQNIRSKGPLLIIVIGLALFAFIAGDAWKVVQPHQSQDVGEVNGKSLSALEFQQMIEEYSEMIKFTNNLTTLTEEQNNQIKDEVWRAYVNNRLIQDEADKIGITVTDAEIQAIINAGVHPMLRNTPFYNQQTGRFDNDMLKKILADYAKMTPGDAHPYYESMVKFWMFLERNLRQSRLAEKYQALIVKSMSSNPVEAESSFQGRANQMDLLLAAVPYSSVADSTIKVESSEVRKLYNKKKEQYRQYAESRDLKYIDVQITPSAADRTELENEVTEYTEQLIETGSDYAALVRSAGSDYPYVDIYYSRKAYPADVIARLDSVAIGEVYGPYFNASDNTFNSFKKIARTTAPDSVEFRQIQVYDADITKTRALADSIFTALKGGAKFEDLAARYNQQGTATWISSANYENAPLDSDNLKYITAITTLGKNELQNVEVGTANVILQVTDRRGMEEKYKVAVIKRTVVFSNETYNKAYNNFSQFIAGNPTLKDMEANAEDSGYRLLERKSLYSSEHTIGGIKGTKEALRWAFSAKPGEVSKLYEAGDNNDRLVVVGLESVTKEGYRSIESVQPELWREVAKQKKADKIIAEMKKLNATSIDQYASTNDAVIDTVKHVTFSAPAYISALYGSEPVVSAYASVAELGRLSPPMKGNEGVLVMEVYYREKLNEEFDAETEEENMVSMNQRITASRFVNDLYLKGNVKDNRYLFF